MCFCFESAATISSGFHYQTLEKRGDGGGGEKFNGTFDRTFSAQNSNRLAEFSNKSVNWLNKVNIHHKSYILLPPIFLFHFTVYVHFI